MNKFIEIAEAIACILFLGYREENFIRKLPTAVSRCVI